jgi:glycosyltransferase involved in cell wall biosynthesis
MRILHLGYEDPAQPGSGGGSVRTREVNRRLSSRHEITVLTAGYPGAESRIEDGVRWVPLWPRTGNKIDRLAYFAQVGLVLRRFPHDLIVEEFSAPFSTAMTPYFTHKPVIASVQWLFAREMRKKYHLPFDLVERKGLKLYHHFIAVSDWLAAVIKEQQPQAEVTCIANGVDPQAFSITSDKPEHLLFVGRLDIEQKGCDMLVEIAARVQQLLGEKMPPLLIVGDGPDQPEIERRVRQAGMSDVIRFCGRKEGRAKFDLMARSYAVLMPSRFETFGIVAVESQAAGAPLVTFDVGPLKGVTGEEGAFLIPPFDLDAFARTVAGLVTGVNDWSKIGQLGREWARKYNWDDIARAQEEVYNQVLLAHQAASRHAVD